jgi:hypothetical protein
MLPDLKPWASRSRRTSRASRTSCLTSFAALLAGSMALLALCSTASHARVIEIPASFRTGPPQGGTGDGLLMRFKDVSAGCALDLCRASTDTVSVAVTTMPNINFLLNQGCSIAGFNHGCGWFHTRWDTYLDIRAAGDYVFAMQVDDQASVAIGDSLVLFLEGAHWFESVRSDTIRFQLPGSYPLRAYYSDCQPCCRGFRLGGMGPEGSGMMAFNPTFDFNTDLGPCCTFGTNGPGLSIVPAALFFKSPPVVAVESPSGSNSHASIMGVWASPNPAPGPIQFSLELAREQRVWVDFYDASGRRVASLADGTQVTAGVTRWSWAPGRLAVSGSFFYQVRTEDGSSARGRFTTIR